jgi:hypothetical protein
MRPHLCRLAILGVNHVDKLELKLLTSPLGADRDEHDRVVLADQDIMHLRLDSILRQFPGTFSVPTRFIKHMMVVADLASGDAGAIEDALEAAWRLQRGAG